MITLFGTTYPWNAPEILLLAGLALLGVACGNWLFTRISQRAFRVFIYVVLASNSAFLLWSLRDAL